VAAARQAAGFVATYLQRHQTALGQHRRGILRRIALMSAAFVIAASAPAFAAGAWHIYMNETWGYSAQFPGEPTEGTGVYRADLIPEAPTHIARYKDGDGTFSAVVIEAGREEDGAFILGEFEYWLGHVGTIALSSVSRLNVGMEYGRFLTIDCSAEFISEDPNQALRAPQMFEDAAGIECPDGARMSVNFFYSQGKIYAMFGVMAGPDARESGAPGRFVNSFGWEGENSERARNLIDWDAVTITRGQTMANQTSGTTDAVIP
jgi:hypothetical protein